MHIGTGALIGMEVLVNKVMFKEDSGVLIRKGHLHV